MSSGNIARARALLDAGSYREAGELFVAAGELASAARAFAAARDHFRAAVCYEKACKPLDAARLYQQIRHWSKAAELFAAAGDPLQAELAMDQLRKEQEQAGRARGPATGWAQVPLHLAPAAHTRQGAAASRPGPEKSEPSLWPPGEIWQAIRAGDIPGAARLYLAEGNRQGWNLLAEAASPEARRGLAETLLQAGEHAVAAEAFQKAGDAPRAAQCLSLAGLNEEAAHAYYGLGQLAVAAQHLEKAHAWGEAAAIYLQEGRLLDAARCHEKDDDPARAAALYLKAGKTDLALPLLQSVAPAHRSFTPCRLLAGKILFQKGQTDLALSMIAPLLQAAPATDDGMDTLYQAAVLMEAGGAPERAREAYQRLQEARFGYKDVTERLGRLAAAPPATAPPATAPSRTPPPPAAPRRQEPPPQAEDADLAADLGPLRSCSLFHRLGIEDLRRVWSIGKSGEVKPGKVLVKAGEVAAGLMVVLAGGVTITPDPADPTAAAGFLGPGDFVGLGSLLQGPPQANHLVAQRNTRLLVLPPAAFEGLLAGEPELGMRFYRSAAEHLIQTLAAGAAPPAT